MAPTRPSPKMGCITRIAPAVEAEDVELAAAPTVPLGLEVPVVAVEPEDPEVVPEEPEPVVDGEEAVVTVVLLPTHKVENTIEPPPDTIV